MIKSFLPTVPYIDKPRLAPQAPSSVEGDGGVVEASPAGLTELVHHCRLACQDIQNSEEKCHL